MSLNVLPDKPTISSSRRELESMGVSTLDGPLLALARRYKLVSGIKLGDMVKSWDVLKTVKFLDTHISKDDPVLDIGCYASEITAILHKLGYTNLAGADLNPDVIQMPFHEHIRFQVADFMQTSFADESFAAITSISVIEHGFDGPRLLTEMSRLLRPNGYFIASFDYWPEKIDTTDTKFFNMNWTIFSKEEVRELVALAASHGLAPVGDLEFNGSERPIKCGGRKYTFGWLCLRKK